MSCITVLSQAIKDDRADDFCKFMETNPGSDILSPENMDRMAYTLLLEACFYKRSEIVRFLLTRGCRITPSSRSDTPLHMAVSAGDNLDIIDCLMTHGASLSIKNEDGQTPLHVAFLTSSSDDVLDSLLNWACRTGEGNLKDNNGLSFLHIAATRPNLEVVEYFIKNSESPECVNGQVVSNVSTIYSGYTPLHFAVKKRSFYAAVLLSLRPNIDIHSQDANLSTPIHLACEMRDQRMVRVLLNQDKKKNNSVNKFGLSHFMAACMTGDLQLVDALLNASRNHFDMVNGRVDRAVALPFAGFTPLHFAAENGFTEVVKRLLQVGAKIYPEKCTPLVLALRNNHHETAYIFQVLGNHRKTSYVSQTHENQHQTSHFFQVHDGRKRRRVA